MQELMSDGSDDDDSTGSGFSNFCPKKGRDT